MHLIMYIPLDVFIYSFYLTTLPGKPSQRHLFSVTDMESSMPRTEECITCDMDEECTFFNAIFSPGAKYYVLECLGPGVPWIELRATIGHIKCKFFFK